jgi:hypothetical protein
VILGRDRLDREERVAELEHLVDDRLRYLAVALS